MQQWQPQLKTTTLSHAPTSQLEGCKDTTVKRQRSDHQEKAKEEKEEKEEKAAEAKGTKAKEKDRLTHQEAIKHQTTNLR